MLELNPIEEMIVQIEPWIRALIGLSMALPLMLGVWMTRHDVS